MVKRGDNCVDLVINVTKIVVVASRMISWKIVGAHRTVSILTTPLFIQRKFEGKYEYTRQDFELTE